MHEFVETERKKPHATPAAYAAIDAGGDLPVGMVMKAAVESGLHLQGVAFPDSYLDIGTPGNLVALTKNIEQRLRGDA